MFGRLTRRLFSAARPLAAQKTVQYSSATLAAVLASSVVASTIYANSNKNIIQCASQLPPEGIAGTKYVILTMYTMQHNNHILTYQHIIIF